MEPVSLAAGVVAVLTPLLSKGAEAFMDEVGKSVFEKASSLWSGLRAKWQGEAVQENMLDRYAAKPGTYQTSIQDMLAETLQADPDFARLLAGLMEDIKQAGPELNIIMEIETAEAEVMGLASTGT